MSKEEIAEKKKENWYEAWFMIEALGIEEEVVKNALEKHVSKMKEAKNTYIYESKLSEATKVKNPLKGVEEAFSQVIEVKLFAKDLFTLISLVLLYGPSSAEILNPNKKEIKLEEAQNISNMLAGIVHQFASAGLGGIVITPDKK